MPDASNLHATPAALLDLRLVQQNIVRMQQRMNRLGVAFRPHVKTSKCVALAERQRVAGARGITVSTLHEAEVFFDAGFNDILYAVCIAPARLPRALALRQRGCRLSLVVDSLPAAQAVAACAAANHHQFDVLIEVDTDGHRAGVDAESPDLLQIAVTLGAHLQGVMAHAGSSYACSDRDVLAVLAEQERARSVRAAERIRQGGQPCPVVSIGSTPTALSARNLAGVTEVRAGVYLFFDLVMAGTGVCRLDDIALSVLCTVIGHQTERGWILVDAGWMALSRDRGTQLQRVDHGYGAVCRADGSLLTQLYVAQVNQEHGIVQTRSGTLAAAALTAFPIGTQLRILPNHACATAAQHRHYVAIDETGATQILPRLGGW